MSVLVRGHARSLALSAQRAGRPVRQQLVQAGRVDKARCCLQHRCDEPRLQMLTCKWRRSTYLCGQGRGTSRPSSPNNEPKVSHATSATVTDSDSKPEGSGPLGQLKKWGVVGIATFGLLNGFYYMVVIPFAVFMVAKVEPGLGWQVAVQRLTEVAVSAWAMSQVIKVPRAVLALGLAPVMANVFEFVLKRTALTTKTQVLWLLVAGSFAAFFTEMLAIVVYLT